MSDGPAPRDARVPSPVAVLGCGLVGASMAAGLSAAGIEVWGADRRDLAPLVERGWLAREVSFDQVGGAELVVLALPPRGVLGALARLPFRDGQVVTDVASVKGPVVRAAAGLPGGIAFVGGHPMAGGTGAGYEAARPDLFQGAAWIVLPSPEREARSVVEGMVRKLGARPVEMEAALHDKLVARTSHLPQLLSTALAAELAELEEEAGSEAVEAVLGPGGRDYLRLARSPYGLWGEILALNGEEVGRALAAVAARAALPAEALEQEFDRARGFMKT